MNRSLIIAPAATQDLEQILDFLFLASIDAGDIFVNAFERKCSNIAAFPNIGRGYAQLAPALRGVPLDGYIILYVVSEECVEIVRVVSGKRNLKALFEEPEA
jgi:toxin ParE1/3/4